MPAVPHFKQTSSSVSKCLFFLWRTFENFEIERKFIVELVQGIGPFQLAFLDLVQLLFHSRV